MSACVCARKRAWAHIYVLGFVSPLKIFLTEYSLNEMILLGSCETLFWGGLRKHCAKDVVSCVKDDVGCVKDVVGCVKDDIGCVKDDVGCVKDVISCGKDDIGCVKDLSLIHI